MIQFFKLRYWIGYIYIQKNDMEFELIQIFSVKELKRPGNIKKQIRYIKKNTNLRSGLLFFLPTNIFFICLIHLESTSG